MVQQTPDAERFKQQVRDSLQHKTLNLSGCDVRAAREYLHLRRPGRDGYFIETGQIKLLLLSSEGKESLCQDALSEGFTTWRCELQTNSTSSPIW
jgi:hypothetical protein